MSSSPALCLKAVGVTLGQSPRDCKFQSYLGHRRGKLSERSFHHDYAAHGYGAIPPAPPYLFPVGTGPGYTTPATSQPHNYPNTTYIIIQQPPPTTSVIVVGGCPACRVGVLEDTFTCLGILCAIFFFPVGIIFCLALRQQTCPNCGATFG